MPRSSCRPIERIKWELELDCPRCEQLADLVAYLDAPSVSGEPVLLEVYALWNSYELAHGDKTTSIIIDSADLQSGECHFVEADAALQAHGLRRKSKWRKESERCDARVFVADLELASD